jgi:hypothetical protein
MGESGDDRGERHVVDREPQPLPEGHAVRLAPHEGLHVVVRLDQRVGGRVPRVGVDPVQDADEIRAPVAQRFVQTEPSLTGDDLGGVVRRHGHDPIRQREAPRQRVRVTPPFEVPRSRPDQAEPGRIGDPLVGEVVERQHARRGNRERREGRGGVPVVEMEHVGWVVFDVRRHGSGEAEEALAVVDPSLTVGLQVGMRTFDAGHRHEVEPTDDRVRADAQSCPPHPRRYGEIDEAFVCEFDAAVVRHHELDVDALASQLQAQAGCCRRQATDRRDRRQFGSGEHDSHGFSLPADALD